MATVTVRGLHRGFDGHKVLDGLDLDIEGGEFVASLGRSGSGKSTLLKALAGLDRHTEGTITIRGNVSVAFQEPRLLPWKRVIDNLRLAAPDPCAATSEAREALAEVGLHSKERAWPLTLSGGEAQRASLARALVGKPDLLLLDEPFSALDALTRITIHRLVKDLWARRKLGVLVVTHDVTEALELATRILVLDRGRVTEGPHDERGRLVALVGNPRPASRTHYVAVEAAHAIIRELAADITPEVVDLTSLAPRLLRQEPSPAIEDALDQVSTAARRGALGNGGVAAAGDGIAPARPRGRGTSEAASRRAGRDRPHTWPRGARIGPGPA